MSRLAKAKKELHMKEMAMVQLAKKGWKLRQEIIQMKHTVEVLEFDNNNSKKQEQM